MMVKDLLVLFQAGNEGIINLLGTFTSPPVLPRAHSTDTSLVRLDRALL